MLTIISERDCPDSTYFTTRDVEPDLRGDALTIYNGEGRRRSSWGAPGVTSTIVLHADDLVSIHIGYHHKHRGGQFWRHYRPITDGQWQQVAWPQLSDANRERILDAAKQHAPAWAHAPGILRSERKAPSRTTHTAYKLVEMLSDGTLRSVYDPDTTYVIGRTQTQRAQPDHGGGFYSYPTPEDVRARFDAGNLFPQRCYRRAMRLTLIECEISGRIIWYEEEDPRVSRSIKYASTHLRPVRVIETFDYTPAQEAVSA